MSRNQGSLSVQSLETSGQVLEAVIDVLSSGETTNFVAEIAGEIPWISSLVGVFNIFNLVQARSLEKKFLAFYYEFNEAELAVFKKAIKKKSNADLGDEIINTLTNVDKALQAQMIARATKLHVFERDQGSDSRMIFDHNMHAIRNLDSYLLSGMISIYGDSPSIPRVASVDQALFNLGLVIQEETTSYISDTNALISFIPSDRGKDFYQSIILGQ